ncbi:MAG: hypothetical protein R2712_27945 [Vicinamibacterales bacterium]
MLALRCSSGADKLEDGPGRGPALGVVVAGIEGVLSKENPRIIREQLDAYLDPEHRTAGSGSKAA